MVHPPLFVHAANPQSSDGSSWASRLTYPRETVHREERCDMCRDLDSRSGLQSSHLRYHCWAGLLM